MQTLRLKELAPYFIAFTLLTFFVRHNAFFWDNILLASQYADWYYTTNFTSLFVSEDIAGYPPLFGMYLALGWKLFGKTLTVSHFLMLPFLFGIIIQVFRLTKIFVNDNFRKWVLFLILLEPTFLALSTQVAPDVILVFLYLYCLNCILSKKGWKLILPAVCLSMLSPRGTIMVAAIFITEILLELLARNGRLSFRLILTLLPKYLPATFITIAWQYLHYKHFGWILYNSEGAWSEGTNVVGVLGFMKNIGLIGWRLLDFGRVSLFILLAFLAVRLYQKKYQLTPATAQLAIITIVPLLTLSLVLVWYANPIGHRYYVVVYMLLILLTFQLLQHFQPTIKLVTVLFITFSFILGHFFVMLYPERISKGWDATLAHLPYFGAKQRMVTYLDAQQIPLNEVGSAFPNLKTLHESDLSADKRGFSLYDLEEQEYVLYSNVFNDFTDEELLELHQNWIAVKEVCSGPVYLILYKRNSNNFSI